MKKLLIALVLACVLALGLVFVVSADNGPHGSFAATTDACASCHRAHSAQVGQNALLKLDPNALCMSCHNGGGAGTNVGMGVYVATQSTTGGNEGTNLASLFGGGFTNALMATTWNGRNSGGTAAVSAPTTSTHHLGAGGTVFGSGAANSTEDLMTLECVSCHDPHGNAGYQMTANTTNGTWSIATAGTPAAPVKVPSYRLLRFQPQGSGGFTAPAASNWSGGAFPTNTTTGSGWTVPDSILPLGAEWYTIGTTGAFAAGDYNAGSASNVYNPSLDVAGRPNYINDASNVAYFCAQCHDRYFANTRLRNDQDMSLRCGYDGIAANNVPAGAVVAKVGTALLPIITGTNPAADCVESSIPITLSRQVNTVLFFTDAAGTVPTVPPSVTYGIGTTQWVWGDNGSTGDTVHTYMHSSGDVLRASVDGSFLPTAAGMTAPTNVGRTCVACHVAHGTTSQMTNLASINTLKPNPVGGVNNSVLLRMDNRSLCLRCHADTVGFTIQP